MHGEANLANSLTKSTELEQIDSAFRAGSRWAIVQDDLMLSAKRRRQLGLRLLDESHAEAHFLALKYSWPDLPKELEDELDLEEPVWPDEEVYDDFAMRFIVKSMRRQAVHPHEPRPSAASLQPDRSRREVSGV